MQLSIIGTGKMAEAIIAGVIEKYDVEVIGRDRIKLKELTVKYPKIKNIFTLDSSYDIDDKNLIIAIKPYALESIGIYLSGEARSVISVLAGSSLQKLQSFIKARAYIRAMPNLAATYQKSMTTLCGDKEFKDEAIDICKSFGEILWVDNENELDIATAVAGSGPAFLALVAEALCDGAVKEGLKREDALKLVFGLFEGVSALLGNKHPAIIKDEVMSPNGTTAQGYASLEECGVRDAFIKAISSAYEKTKG